MIRTRTESAVVTYDECDFCGDIVRIEAAIQDERFDARSRTTGFTQPDVWPTHPSYGKSFCCACWNRGRHIVDPRPEAVIRVEGIAVERCWKCNASADKAAERGSCTFCHEGWVYPHPPLLHLGAIIDRSEPCIPDDPLDPSQMHYGLALSSDGECACFWMLHHDHWRPCAPSGSELLEDLADRRHLFLCEHTPRTPYPTVYEGALTDPQPASAWPAAIAERAQGRIDDRLAVLELRPLDPHIAALVHRRIIGPRKAG